MLARFLKRSFGIGKTDNTLVDSYSEFLNRLELKSHSYCFAKQNEEILTCAMTKFLSNIKMTPNENNMSELLFQTLALVSI